jgi:hypothetical protein
MLVVYVAPDPTEVDDLPGAARRRARGDRLGCEPVALLEVITSKRVNEVVDDLRPVERGRDRPGVAGIGRDGLDPSVGLLMRAPGDRDDVVPGFGQGDDERTSDRPGRADDSDPAQRADLAASTT